MNAPTRQTRTAWITLCAVIFAALSSTLAVLYANDHAGIMSEICSATGISRVLTGGEAPAPLPGKSERGVYCADCLSSGSLQAAVAPVMTQLFAQIAGSQAMPGPVPAAVPVDGALPPPSRGPPSRL